MDIAKQLLLQAFLILLNAFFAMTEIAVVGLSSSKLRKLADEGDKTAPRLLKLVEEPTAFLSTIQVGITLAGFLGSAFAADSFSEYLVNWVYNDIGFHGLSLRTLDTLAVIVITIILSYFTLVFGELVPKRIAMQKPMEVARISSGVISSLSVIMRPVIWFLSFSTNAVLRLLRMRTESEEEIVTEDEIRMMVDLGEQKGTIDSSEGEWIDNVFEFGETTAREVMTHAADIVAIEKDAETEEVLRTIRESGRSRIPVYGENIDDILGVLNAREFLLEQHSDQPRTIQEMMRPAYFVPETLRAATLFKDMQSRKQHIAIVIDEYGQTGGVVTMEDLLEEIVGSIYDESDPAEEVAIAKLDENTWRVAGSAYLDELADELDVEFPEDVDFDTLNGLVLSQVSTIPNDGSVLDVQAYGLDIHAEHVEKRKIVSALVRKAAPCEEPEAE